ncbi:MAG: Na+/H+ antiporter NhaC family protein [Bacteroidales bacterium]|nr:Na+/H+ antiporter NhaC family protein [Bacteroidales bacterium]MBR1571035.1 Na+/H+ antiporter NhaC family protein [Bacteroidales bacterium]
MAINTEKTEHRAPSARKMNGWLALSPLAVFLAVYVAASLVARDFYKIPVAAAFIIASAYALLITRGVEKTDDKLSIFSEGAGNKNVLLMIWIFVLAGAFAATAREIGAIDATVNATLHILPGKLIYAGLFLAACFISMAIGTSVGTIVALVPIASGIASETGIGIPFITAIVVGGAFFGDNLSFISDTTVAATKSQGCSMRDKFRANLWIAAPAAVIVAAVYVVMGLQVEAAPAAAPVQWLGLVPYLLVIGLALAGVNVVTVLAVGIGVNGVIGWATGAYGFVGWMASIGEGIGSMGELIIVSLLAGGLLEIIRYNGGMAFIIGGLTRRIGGKRAAGFSIAALVSLVNLCTANNTIAIITVGPLAKDITERFGLDPRKTASILDTFSCFVQGIIPYGAQMLMASGLAGVSAAAIIGHLYYPFALGIVAALSILFRFPRKYS